MFCGKLNSVQGLVDSSPRIQLIDSARIIGDFRKIRCDNVPVFLLVNGGQDVFNDVLKPHDLFWNSGSNGLPANQYFLLIFQRQVLERHTKVWDINAQPLISSKQSNLLLTHEKALAARVIRFCVRSRTIRLSRSFSCIFRISQISEIDKSRRALFAQSGQAVIEIPKSTDELYTNRHVLRFVSCYHYRRRESVAV